YNCVMSSVLFAVLAEQCGVPVTIVARSGHAWCRVDGGDNSFDVETTRSDWKMAPASTGNGNARGVARTLDADSLLAVYYYNKAVRLLRQQHFGAAAMANLAAIGLDRDCHPARQNLCASLNNWAVSLASRGQVNWSRLLLVVALQAQPNSRVLHDNLAIL